MEFSAQNRKTATKTRRKGVFCWMWTIVAFFSAPQLIPIKTKSEQSTIKLVMSRREIGRVTNKIIKEALSIDS